MQQVEIRIKGHIDPDWSDLLAGLRISHAAGGITVLSGPVRDQSSLQGLLSHLFDLGLCVISFSSGDANGTATAGDTKA